MEAPISVGQHHTNARLLQQPLQATPTAPIVNTPPQGTTSPRQAPADLARAARIAERPRTEACAELAAQPVRHEQAAGIAVGNASHWVCVDATPDGSDPVREFPAHTPGLRQLVAWLRECGGTTSLFSVMPKTARLSTNAPALPMAAHKKRPAGQRRRPLGVARWFPIEGHQGCRPLSPDFAALGLNHTTTAPMRYA